MSPATSAAAASSSDSSIHNLIADYYKQKPDFNKYITDDLYKEAPESAIEPAEGEKNKDKLEQSLEDLKLDSTDLISLLRPSGRDVLRAWKAEKIESKEKFKMPVHPAEENATGNITDQVAKESSDSTASTHLKHEGPTGATSGGSLHANAHKANPGPVVAENIGKPASKEELKKRSEELNK